MSERTRTHRWGDPAEMLAKAATLSGLELFEAMKRRELPSPPVATLIGVAGLEVEKGRAAIGFEPAEFHYNTLGAVHGGVIATVLDIVLGSAVQTTLKAGEGVTTLTLELKYHRAITASTGLLRAEAKIVTRGREIVTAEATLTDPRARLFASATSTLTILRRGKKAE